MTTAQHPAAPSLRRAARGERRALIRALAIEADWRFHDGPEWAARYWAAFGDLRRDASRNIDMRLATRTAPRLEWSMLDPGVSNQGRIIFRALVAVLHPQVAPAAAAADIRGVFSRALRAYPAGDIAALRALVADARELAPVARLPSAIVALRREHERLVAARTVVDARLASLADRFPFNLRDRLNDPDWIRRQRLMLRQAIVFTETPRSLCRDPSREQVS